MAPEVRPPAQFSAPLKEYVRQELWRSDPNLTGKGIGLLISESRGKWRIRRVLKKSPAERAGVEQGSLL
jgi:C-terminal processing protease CtpA/Prc